MSSEAIRHSLRIVASHGFDATPLYDGVCVNIDLYVDGKWVGVEVVECRTYREVFAALGY